MNEEKAVLEFFSRPENLPLGLSVAGQINEICERINSRFWQDFQERIDTLFAHHAPEWQTQVTEDRNAPNMLVGLQCKLREPQEICLFPMLEQQYLGSTWRIFFGLMWQNPPAPDQLALPAVVQLKQALNDAGFKTNENFLAWQWTNFYPRRRDFLLRFSQQPEKLFDEIEPLLTALPLNLIRQANAALSNVPKSQAISQEQLRRKRES